MSTDPQRKVQRGQGRAWRRGARRARSPQLTARDLDILRWIARHGVVTAELVGRRFFWRPERRDYGKWAAYRRLRALGELGYVQSNKPFAHRSAVLRVTREGARIADVGLRPATLVLAELEHTLALVALTEYLLFEYRGAELTTERELRAQRYRALRDGVRETEVGRTPDALLRLPTKSSVGAQGVETVAIELDIKRKDRRTMESVVRRYDHEAVDRVWWYVPRARVARTREVVELLHAEDRFEVRTWPA